MRPRRPLNRDLEPHVYPPSAGSLVYRYYDQRTGRIVSLKTRDRALANQRGRMLNAAIAQQLADLATQQLISGTPAASTLTLSQWAETYLELQQQRLIDGDIRPATLEVTRGRLRAIIQAHGPRPLSQITTRDIHALISDYTDAGKRRSAQQIRTVYRDLLAAAIAAGELERNPADATRAPRQRTQRARLTLEDFAAIRADAEGWVVNLMDLAIVTGQRREDLRQMRFRDLRDGYLHVQQGKTGARLRIDADLRLDALGLSVAEVITQCRDRVLSPYLLHHTHHAGRAKPGHPIRATTLSQAFAAARDASGLIWAGTPPSLHELRSLAARLYERQGISAKALLGHTTERMHSVYQDSRGREWVDVRAVN